jgi:hypothetical protein
MSERQVMPVSARQHFEAVFRQVGPGEAATMNALRAPLKVIAVLAETLSPAAVENARRVDARA